MRICVTSIGSISGAFVVKRLKQLNHHVTGINSRPASTENLCDSFAIARHSNDEVGYITDLIDLRYLTQFECVIPLTDPESYLLAKNKDLLLQHGIRVMAPSKESLELVRDKLNLFRFQENWLSNHFSAIPTYTTQEDAISAHGFPIICKPRVGRSSEGIAVINGESSRNTSFVNYIFQPLIEGDVITVDAIRSASMNQVFCLPRIELERTLNGAGTKVRTFQDNSIEKFVADVLTYFDIVGCVNIELLKTGNRYYIMDFNLRFSAGIEFSFAAGFDFVGALLSQEANLGSFFPPRPKELTMININGSELKILI